MDVDMEPSNVKMKTNTLNDMLPDYACRVCLFRDKENSEMSRTFAQYVSRHLCFQIDREADTHVWMCKFCEQSLLSFHDFYVKVSQIQESLTNLVTILDEGPTNLDQRPILDEEFDAINLTVGFGRGKTPVKELLKKQPGRVGTRSRTKSVMNTTVNEEHSVNMSKRKEEIETVSTNPSDHNTNKENTVSSMTELGDRDTECLAEPEKSVLCKDDDLSSLEDQDWVGRGFSYDSDESSDDIWKPLPSRSKRKKGDKQEVNSNSNQMETCQDEDTSDDEKNDVKKPKIKITATHGTDPKPKVKSSVKKMVRDEINAKFVEFYGISCDICIKNQRDSSMPEPAKYDSFVALCDHMKSAHNVRGYIKCCNCTMRDKRRAERHMLLHTQPGSIFKCNICGKQLSTDQSFRSHIILHLPDKERPHQCTQCDRGFATKPDLILHERSHLPEDKRLMFTCDICGSRFAYENGLLVHKQRVHENNRPHLCDICARSFKSRCDMERHRAQTHGDVKREQCPECDKWFKGKSILKTHMRQHMGASFQCEHCDKTYAVRSSWKAHLLTHSNEKPYKCPVCHKAFKLPGTLKMHLNQHTGEHPYSCPFCPKTFASSGNYYTHRKRMHPNEVAALKKNTEEALAANGLPPPPTGPVVPPQSISEAIERTKEKVATKAKQNPSVNENFVSVNVNALSNDGEVSEVVSPSTNILTEKSVRSNTLSNALIMSSAVTAPEGNGVNFLLPNGVKVVRIISANGASKFAFGRKGQETINLTQQSLIPLDTQVAEIDTSVTQENSNP